MNKSDNYQKDLQQFNKWAKKYDRGLWNIYFYKGNKKALSLISSKKGARVLDVGCGTGNLSFLIAQDSEVLEVVGMDISPKMIQIAQQKLNNSKIMKNKLMFIESDVINIPYPDHYFDYVYCMNSFHHYEDQKVALKEMHRVLKPGGYFVHLDPFVDNLIRRGWGRILKLIFNESHVIYHHKKELHDIIRNQGFDIIEEAVFAYFTLFTKAKKK